jgi:hypothetical protein
VHEPRSPLKSRRVIVAGPEIRNLPGTQLATNDPDERGTVMSLAKRWLLSTLATLVLLSAPASCRAGVLPTRKLLEAQTFWDNRDWNWYERNIPFFECPDADITTTYYYRWELATKHLTYGSPNCGYTFTEFIDRPFWSGTYGAISCPAGHQLYEVRWLRDPRYAFNYCHYWFRTPGAEPRRYSTWLADAVRAVVQVHPNDALVKDLLPDLIANYRGWEKRHFVESVGLFWQTGHDDGMEININSRQTRDTVRGAPGYRPTLNSYLYADALAISAFAERLKNARTAQEYRGKAARLKANLQKKLWDPKRQFFLHLARDDEKKGDHVVKALSLTYQTGQFAGSKHGREQIGFVPWQFNLPDAGYAPAWKFLMDKAYFFSPFGPTTVERHDPQFLISKTCCVWSGNSWPYATTQTLKALANLLHKYKQDAVSREDYLKLLRIYARTHLKAGKPYIAEACHPDTGSWEGHDSYNHSEHYFHSGFTDLVITGLCGLITRDDDTLEVHPLAPDSWDYFVVDDVPYRGHRISIVWDRLGTRYKLGQGFHLLVDGEKQASWFRLDRVSIKLPSLPATPRPATTRVNFAVNNDGTYYPKLQASFVNGKFGLGKLIDGNYWYHATPPNRWTFEGSPNAKDWLVLELGAKRRLHTVKLYLLEDGPALAAPEKIDLEYHDGKAWQKVSETTRVPAQPEGRRANTIGFREVSTDRFRLTLTHRGKARTGLSEIEAWGDVVLPVAAPPPPAGNLAYNPTGKGFPRLSASHTSRFDQVSMANDGIISYQNRPHNRWTSYDSPNASDWLEVDFGTAKTVSRIELAIYDDRGGVQAPARYTVEYHDGKTWREASNQKKMPAVPVGGQLNEVRFDAVKTSKVRVVFTHRGKARSGVSEILVWTE